MGGFHTSHEHRSDAFFLMTNGGSKGKAGGELLKRERALL